MAEQGSSGVGKGVWLSLAVVAVVALVWFGSQADHASVEDEGTVMPANRYIAETAQPSPENESGSAEEVEIDDSAGIDPDKTDEERSEAEEAAEGKNTGNLQLG
ncbi:MAG: hypothetical protein ACO21O_03890 [Steroidobacteraceae bacterium]